VLKWLRGKVVLGITKRVRRRPWLGHFDIVKWAREEGCPWDTGTYSAAIRSGNYDLWIWVNENGCPREEIEY